MADDAPTRRAARARTVAGGQVVRPRRGAPLGQPHPRHEGSIHALIGENGAGKSTLVKIIAGLYRRDAGEFLLDGESVDFHTTAQSKAAGIAVIYQEPTLFPDLSVTENIFMGRQPTNRFGRIDRKAMRAEAHADLRAARRHDRPRPRHRGPLDRRPADHRDREGHLARRPGAHHGRADRRASAASRSSGCSRSPGACATRVARCCSSRTASTRSSRSATPSRSCATAATSPPRPIAETSVDELVRQMVGRDVAELFPKLPAEIGDDVLVVDGLTRAGVFHDISFTVRAGEIVGLAGLVGAGRSEVARAIFGVDPYESRHRARSTAGRCRRATRASRWRAASPSCPRTAASRASCSTRASPATSRSPSGRRSRRCGLLWGGAENAAAAAVGQPARGEDRGARRRDRHAERRQPAEGRARQVARDRAEGADRRRADPRHRRRHEGRGAPPALANSHSRESRSS